MKGKKRLLGIGDNLTMGNGVPVLAPLAVSATQTSAAGVDAGEYDDALIYINISIISTSTLTVSYEVSPDNGLSWCIHTQSAALAAIGQTVLKVVRPIGLMWRIRGIYGGSGNQTYVISIDFSRDGP